MNKEKELPVLKIKLPKVDCTTCVNKDTCDKNIKKCVKDVL